MLVNSETVSSRDDQEGWKELAEQPNGANDVDVSVVQVPGVQIPHDSELDGSGEGIVHASTVSTDRRASAHEAVGHGWVDLHGDPRDDAVFMISGSRLGIGPSGADSVPIWFDLNNVKNVDAIGDVVDGTIEVEIRTSDGTLIGAGWPEEFCQVVLEALRSTVESPTPTRTLLELEDVTYLGGFPGHPKKKKRCTAILSTEGIEISGHPNLTLGLAWDEVSSLEAQNSDEARFRTNTKIHRDASAIIIEPKDGDLVVLEARDCPTVALRQAILTLLKGVDVAVR